MTETKIHEKSKETPQIGFSEATEYMIDYVRANLVLDEKSESTQENRMTIKGKGITEKDAGIEFSLELMLGDDYTKKTSKTKKKIDNIVDDRSSEHFRKDRIYTAFLFPKSVDYKTAETKAITPYFKQADLLQTINTLNDKELLEKYSRFSHYDVKELSRTEWEIALPLGGSRIAYYNPLKKIIQVHDFQKFQVDQIIPANRPIDQGYFWDYVKSGTFPSQTNMRRKACIFKGIQQGLHDRVRRIIRTEDIQDKFTLSANERNGAMIVPYASNS
ncbi:MAG: hypothetical protein Q8O89_03070 [Nanoarchaeota archaeon]|nr:hypothetical protein [Nanoarchaeota archaeon]